MCLIIKKPAGRHICPDFIENAWRRNHDGWGSFHLEAGRPVARKGMDLASLQAHNQRLPREAEVFLHLRKATYGHVHHDMAHPYRVRDGMYLMHNGSIDHLAPSDPERSDSAELARLLGSLLHGLSEAQAIKMVRSEGFTRLLAPVIQGSMVVLLDAQGPVSLGRDWHRVQPREWGRQMQDIEVSNTHAWVPLCAASSHGERGWWHRLLGGRGRRIAAPPMMFPVRD